MGSNQQQQKLRLRDGSQSLIVERTGRPVTYEMLIREGAQADHAAAEELQNAAFGEAPWQFGDDRFYVAELADGEMLGYLVWRQTFTDEFEILSIAVHPTQQRKGVGRALMQEFLAANVSVLNRGDVFLEVRESNVGAIEFYQSMGFETTGVRPAYYSDSGERAIVMRLRFG
jgi:[ribosomal protein S18]-alanine N-acetyltransferase